MLKIQHYLIIPSLFLFGKKLLAINKLGTQDPENFLHFFE